MPTSLYDIPVDVYLSKVYPCLSVNEVLTIRRVNRYIKQLANEYLRVRVPSKTELCLDLRKEGGPRSVEEFLVKDVDSDIRNPSSLLWLIRTNDWTDLSSSNVSAVGRRYGNQITHLRISRMQLPLSLQNGEIEFFEYFKNLKSLTVDTLTESDENLDGALLPITFKNLTTLKLGCLDTKFYRRSKLLLKNFIEYCTNLEYFQYPGTSLRPYSSVPNGVEPTVKGIIEKGTLKKLKFLDVSRQESAGSNPGFAVHMHEMIVKHKMKCLHVSSGVLGHMYENKQEETVANILSLKLDYSEHTNFSATFPSVEEISIFWSQEQGDELVPLLPIEAISYAALPQGYFPALKKLKLFIRQEESFDGEALGRVWSENPNLEEIELEGVDIGDAVFLGPDATRPSFLQLTKLKKLSLKQVCAMKKLTNITFQLVFRHLGLHEFYLSSRKPIESITRNGIKSLLTGRFNETIKIFPFVPSVCTAPNHDWSLADMYFDREEFRQLGREFRCNKEIIC